MFRGRRCIGWAEMKFHGNMKIVWQVERMAIGKRKEQKIRTKIVKGSE